MSNTTLHVAYDTQVGSSDDLLSFTLKREHWSLILFLCGRGVIKEMDAFVKDQKHDVKCIAGFAEATRALQDQYIAAVPDAAKTAAEDTLKPMLGHE